MNRDVFAVLVAYPQIWHACHTHHRRGARTGDPLTDRESSVLAHVSASSPASPKSLAKHLGITPATLSAVIDRLLEKNLLNREQHASDKRRHALTLTNEGVKAVLAGSALSAERVQAALERMPPGKRARAVEGLTLLASACRELRS